MNRFCSAVVIMALSVSLWAPASAEAAEIKVSKLTVTGDPAKGVVDVEFYLEFTADAPGDVVFLCVAAGQDAPHQISAGSAGNFKGNVKAKLSTKKSWDALKGTRGNKPIPILVHACQVYDLQQASVWIANHASYSKAIQTVYPK